MAKNRPPLDKAIERALASMAVMLDQLAAIRYCEWPSIGLGIGLQEEVLDEMLEEGERAEKCLQRAKQSLPKE